MTDFTLCGAPGESLWIYALFTSPYSGQL